MVDTLLMVDNNRIDKILTCHCDIMTG